MRKYNISSAAFILSISAIAALCFFIKAAVPDEIDADYIIENFVMQLQYFIPEQSEKLQYILSVLLFPFIYLTAYKAVKKMKFSAPLKFSVSLMLFFNILCAAVFCLMYFLSEKHCPSYSVNFKGGIFAAAAVLYFLLKYMQKRNRLKFINVILSAVFILNLIQIFNIKNFSPLFIDDLTNFEAYFSPVIKTISGLAPGIDFYNLYGFYPYVYSFFFNVFSIPLSAVVPFNASLAVLTVLLLSSVLFINIKNKCAVFAAITALCCYSVFYPDIIYAYKFDLKYPVFYYQYMPHRVIFPAIIMFLISVFPLIKAWSRLKPSPPAGAESCTAKSRFAKAEMTTAEGGGMTGLSENDFKTEGRGEGFKNNRILPKPPEEGNRKGLSAEHVYERSRAGRLEKIVKYSGFAVCASALFWNLESGIAALAGWSVYHLYLNFNLKNAVKISAAAAAAVIAAFAGILAASYFQSGQLINPFGMLAGAFTFYIKGFYMLPMDMFKQPFIPVLFIYAAAVSEALRGFIDKNINQRNAVKLAIAAAGLGAFLYFQGRSHTQCLAASSYPAFILLAFYLQELQEAAARCRKIFDRKHVKAFRILEVLYKIKYAAVFIIIAALALNGMRLLYLPHKKYLSPAAEKNIQYLAENPEIYDFWTMESAAYHIYFNLPDKKPVQSASDIFYKKDLDKVKLYLEKSDKKLVIDAYTLSFIQEYEPLKNFIKHNYNLEYGTSTMMILRKNTGAVQI